MKDTRELRNFLLNQMRGVADGNVDIATAKGIANLAQQVYNTVNMEIKMALAEKKIDRDKITPVKFDDS